jgi:hypothetical protein
MRNAWDNPLNVHLGYRYTGSPICIADGVPPPEPEDSRDYVQTSYPGCRAPHAWLRDGRSTLDLFGHGFTLLRFDPSLDAPPISTVTVEEPEIARLYERKLVLVRPDGHVAWRGDTLPRNIDTVLDQVRGAA